MSDYRTPYDTDGEPDDDVYTPVPMQEIVCTQCGALYLVPDDGDFPESYCPACEHYTAPEGVDPEHILPF